MIDKKHLNELFKYIMNLADKKASNAGHAGEMNTDYGAAKLREQVFYYKAGMNSQIPAPWADYYKDVYDSFDPEWEEYQRLRNKFEK